jgi:RND family efflux transporter MFP subunit
MRLLGLVVLFCSVSGLTGCGRKQQAPAAPPPPPVTVAHPVQREVTEWDAFNGYLEATESVNVAARVSGMITAAPFAEGSLVRKSQVLFTIDDRPFKADLALKISDQEKAAAQLVGARLYFQRQEQSITTGVGSQQDYEQGKADYAKAEAALAGAKAAVELSRLNLEWCQVAAPINGRVSKKMVTPGNLVNGGAGAATLLTTIQSVDPIYCNFDVDERSVLKYQKLATEKKRVHEREGPVPCFVRLSHETDFPYSGYVDFVDNRVDSTTGTLRARMLLQNPSGLLTPGFYANLRIPGSGRYKTLLVPDTAIGNDQSQRTVLVVNKENTVEVRQVQTGALFGELRSITSGLSPDELVIINGQMRAFPGAPVAPTVAAIKVDPSSFAEPGAVARPVEPAPVPTLPTAAQVKTGGAP